MLNDLRFAMRMLLKAPGFAAVAVLTLALGIGANTVIFSLIDSVFLHGLAFERTDELVRIYGDATDRNLSRVGFSPVKFEHVRDHQSSFAAIGGGFFAGFTMTGAGDPEQLNGLQVSSNYLDLLGVKPAIGRLFTPEEETGDHVALLSDDLWTSHFNRDPHVVGKVLTLNGVPHTVVGVLPPQPVAFFGRPDVWTTRPEEWPGMTPELRARGFSFMQVIGRLKPGVTLAQAQLEVNALADTYKKENASKADSAWHILLVNLEEDTLGGGLRSIMWMLFGAVGFVLLIATSNVANLLLVRFAGRRREIAVRTALGAARARVIRLFLIESVTMSLLSAVVGALLAQLSLALLLKIGLPLPVGQTLQLNGLVLAFTAGVAMITGFAMGLYPALQAAKADVVDALKDSGRGNSMSRGQQRFRMTLLGGQVALSFVLLVGAFLLLMSLTRLQHQNPGFTPDRVLLAGINLPSAHYPDKPTQAIMTDRLLDTLRHSPGIRNAALVIGAPLAGGGLQGPYSRGDKVVPYTERPLGPMRFVTPGYFSTMGIRLIAGQDFSDHDGVTSARRIILSETAVRRIYPEGNPLGKHMLIGAANNRGEDAEIIGVAADVRSVSLSQEPVIEIYRALPQRPGNAGNFQLVVATESADPAAASSAVRTVLRGLDKDLPLLRPTPMVEIVGGSVAGQQLLTSLLGTFAALALGLAVVGIYSLVAYMVGQRTPEIGVRLALGAEPSDVTRLVLRQGMLPVVVGLIAGVGGALLLGQTVQGLLFGTTRFDPSSFGLTALSVIVASMLACWIPARRAAKIGPSVALRN